MYKTILPLLMCPCCKRDFSCHEISVENEDVVEGYLECSEGHRYRIFKGVVDFGSLEQVGSNSWSEYYKDTSYEELDKSLEKQKTENQKMIQEKFINAIVNKTSELKDGFLLDIASGRGLLLKQLIQSTSENIHIISSDLSFQVLMYDRIKFANLNPNVKVSYVACDATNLPFKTNSIDMICTFAGYLNMGNIFEKGIIEAARVKKSGAKLINSVIYMNPDTPGYAEVKKITKEYDMEDLAKLIIQNEVLDIHKQYYNNVYDEIIYEGIAEAEEGDLLPYDNEWFADAIIIAE